MQSSGSFQNFKTGTKVEVIGMALNNLGFYLIIELVLVDSFDTALGANRHKNRRLNVAIAGLHYSGPGTAGRVFGYN